MKDSIIGILNDEPLSRRYYVGVNRKCPESFHPIFLPDYVTQAQTWGTAVIPYTKGEGYSILLFSNLTSHLE